MTKQADGAYDSALIGGHGLGHGVADFHQLSITKDGEVVPLDGMPTIGKDSAKPKGARELFRKFIGPDDKAGNGAAECVEGHLADHKSADLSAAGSIKIVAVGTYDSGSRHRR